MKKSLAISLLVGGVAMGVYAHQITSIAEVNKMNTEVFVQRTAPTAGEQAALRKQGNTIVNYALNKGPKAWKSLYTSGFRRVVVNVDRKFFSDKDNLDMGCYRVFLEYQLHTTYPNQRVSDIRLKRVKATSATRGDVVLEYTWETDDYEGGSTYHKELRTLKMRKEQGKWLIDDILVGGESAKKYLKSTLAYDIFC